MLDWKERRVIWFNESNLFEYIDSKFIIIQIEYVKHHGEHATAYHCIRFQIELKINSRNGNQD